MDLHDIPDTVLGIEDIKRNKPSKESKLKRPTGTKQASAIECYRSDNLFNV